MITQVEINYIYSLCQKGDIHQMNIVKFTPNFTVGEFFQGIPPAKFKEIKKEHIKNLFKVAAILQALRKSLFKNKPIIISPQGGWRDKNTQKLLVKGGKGAVKSQHLLGNAVDFNVRGLSAKEVQLLLRLSKLKYTIGLGFNFTHLDRRIGIGEFTYG